MARNLYPQALDNLLEALGNLPGIGSRSAQRIAIDLLKKPAHAGLLSKALNDASTQITACSQCGFFANDDLCALCSNLQRDHSTLCVVESASDIIPLESAEAFHGLYHCLGGLLSPLDGIGPEDLRIDKLLERIKNHPHCEVILALPYHIEGEATAHYLCEILSNMPCSVTRIAQGLPAGGALNHADGLTLLRAFEGRRPF